MSGNTRAFIPLTANQAVRVLEHFRAHVPGVTPPARIDGRRLTFYRNTNLCRFALDGTSKKGEVSSDNQDPFIYFLFCFDRGDEILLPLGEDSSHVHRANEYLELVITDDSAADYVEFFLNLQVQKAHLKVRIALNFLSL